MPDATVQDAPSTPASDGGQATAVISSAPIDFGAVPCGSPPLIHTVTVGNTGSTALSLSAATTGSAFTVSPMQLSVPPGGTGMLTITVTLPGMTSAGAALTGSLGIFTSDPAAGNVQIPLSANPSGATVVFAPGSQSLVTFPTTPVGGAPAMGSFTLVNNGNVTATVAVTDPSPAGAFSFVAGSGLSSAAPTTLAPHASVTTNVQFAPTTGGAVTGVSSSLNVTGAALCGTSVSAVNFSGSGVLGSLVGFPPAVNLGTAFCGSGAPAPQSFTLVNNGSADEHVTACRITNSDTTFTPCGSGPADASATSGFYASITSQVIPANGGSVTLTVYGFPVPAAASTSAALQGTLTLTLDPPTATPTPIIGVSEVPTGAVLAFAPSTFGSFPSPIVLLGPQATQPFNVVNNGNWPPSGGVNVALTTVSAGADAGVDSGPAPAQAFHVLTPSLSVPQGGMASERNDSLLFSPVAAGVNTATLSLTTVDPATPLCAPLPSMQLIGTGIGAGASVNPSTLTFLAPCSGAALTPQVFTVTNFGQRDLNWQMSAITGAGAARYNASANPNPGLLRPGQSSTVTIIAQPFLALPPGGAPLNPDPAGLAAQLTITTDVPFDTGHVVSLAEIPVGDQLSLSVPSMAFGQFPIMQTTQAQSFVVSNAANAGSSDARYSLVIQGTGAPAYMMSPAASGVSLSAGTTSAAESVTFAPTTAIPYPATVAITTTDTGMCTPLPAPLALTGTGTAGHATVSPGSLTFGDGPTGLVNCGATAPPQVVTLSNAFQPAGGNMDFNVTSVTLGKTGAGAPFNASISAATPPPFGLPVGNSITVTVTPNPIPQIADPSDATSFHDTLTITTDAVGDSPHVIPLVMQPRGAVIADIPITTTWNFGTITVGSIGTFTNAVQNTGNAGITVALSGLAQPNVFGLRQVSAASGFTSLIGQFTPPALDGSWTDQGTLTMTAAQAFCAAPPTGWQADGPGVWDGPLIGLAGASNSNPPVSISTTALAFATTDCGSVPPPGQTITLTNNTNQPQSFTAQIRSSTHPNTFLVGAGGSAGDGGTAMATMPPMGASPVLVTPIAVTPGPGVLPGSYAGTLEIDVATTPVTTYTIPLSWSLNGAVLTLLGSGTPITDGNGDPFYVADSTTGHLLPLSNTGTAAVTINFAIQPPGAFAFVPAGPVSLLPGLVTSPQMQDLAMMPMCPPDPVHPALATFLYTSGPVCQPFVLMHTGGAATSLPAVRINYCNGTF